MQATKHDGNLKNQLLTSTFQNLKTITNALLTQAMDYSAIREAASSLNKLFSETVAFDETEPANQPHIKTESGLAVGPMSAAFCVIDFLRTRKFILGIRDAIEERLRINPGKPVTVLYAGTGPFATLLTPLISVFSPEQLQMVLIEINPVSYSYLQKTILHFGMEDYIIDAVMADAAVYSIPDHQQPDIIVSETMKPALCKEPQVSIVPNLLSQCLRNPILVPGLVKVEAFFAGNRANNNHDLIHLQTLLELDTATALRIKNNPGDVPVIAEGITVTITDRPAPSFTRLILGTSIRIFNDHWLHFNESSLTVRHPVMEIASIKKFPARLLFQYQMSSTPGFTVTEL